MRVNPYKSMQVVCFLQAKRVYISLIVDLLIGDC